MRLKYLSDLINLIKFNIEIRISDVYVRFNALGYNLDQVRSILPGLELPRQCVDSEPTHWLDLPLVSVEGSNSNAGKMDST